MKIHLYHEGKPQAAKMVFLHGFMGKGRDFARLMRSFSDRFHCIAPDLPGHGRSLFTHSTGADGLNSIDDIVSLILGQLSDQNINDFVLYGYSMGGRIAQAMCLQAPGRVRQLILESASLGIRDDAERQERLLKDSLLLSEVKTEEDFRRFLEKWHRLPLFCTLRGSSLLDDLKTSKLKNDIRQLDGALRLMSVGNQPWCAPELGRTGIPVTYFYGEQDIKYKAIALGLPNDIPAISLKAFTQASHNIHLQFLKEIVSALNELLG